MLTTRRDLFKLGGLLLAGGAALGPPGLLAQEGAGLAEVPVTPTEDLMREHGVLIYEALLAPLTAGGEVHMDVLGEAARIVRRFVEDYHERLEEKYLFPRFERAGRLVGLVEVLKRQHEAGRRLTDTLLAASGPEPGDRQPLTRAMTRYIRMYRPHKAREATVLFPAFREVVPAAGFRELGELFEEQERALFGEQGFERVVAQVGELEKRLGIYELAQFTPRVGAG